VNWLIWRQHRGEAITAALLLAVLAAAVLPAGLHLRDLETAIRAGHCDGSNMNPACAVQFSAFVATSKTLTSIVPWLNLLPALAGIFVGAPLVAREIEDDTWRLVWSQGVSRRQWLSAQLLATIALIGMTIAIFTMVVTWWLAPVDHINGRFNGNGLSFDFYGIVPIGWALLAYAFGVLAGTLTRRVLPAIAISIGVYLTFRLPLEFIARPHYLPAVTRWGVSPTRSSQFGADNWALSQQLVAPNSHHILTLAEQNRIEAIAESRLPAGKTPQNIAALAHYLQAHGYTYIFTYQPASRFWAFQGIEAAICAVLACVAVIITRQWVQRRLT
jgi:hypothetical protein